MPDFKKRLVVVDQDQPTSLVPKKSVQQQNQETEQLLTNLQKKVQTGAASKEEIGLYNQNIQMATNFMKEVDNIRANADNYTSKITKLFNEDFSKLGGYKSDLYSKISQQSMTPMGVTAAGSGYTEEKEAERINQQLFNQGKLKFQQEANKKLSKVQDYLNTGNAKALRELSNYLTGPLQKAIGGVDAQGNLEDEFYNKQTFDRTNRKTANYLLNLARLIDTSNMISNPNDNRTPEIKNSINQNNRVADILNNPGYLKTIGRQLMSQEVGSKLYGKYQLDIHKNESLSTPDNNIDFQATQLAADAIKNLATFDYRKKLAEYTRLKKFAQESGNKVDIEKAENALKQSESILNNTEAFDMDKFLKTNYRQTYLQQKEEEEDAKKRREGVDYWLKGSPIGKAAFDYIPIDPVKLHYSIVSGLKTISNNFVDLGTGISNIGDSDFEKAQNIYKANKITYDKTGYTIGVDENGKPVDSSQFRWEGADGKTHYNGYAIVESGLPVAEQMLETIALAEIGGAALGALRGLAGGATRALIGAERMALLGEKALATPVLGQITKAVTNPEVYNRLRTFGSVYTTTYPRIYAEEYNNFKNPEDATNVAKMRSVVESLTESIIPNTPDLFKKGAGGLFALGKKEYSRDLAAGIDGVVLGMFPGASNKVVRALGESATFKKAVGVAGDVFQEGVIEEEASLLGNYFVDKYAKSKNKDYVEQNELTLKNIISTAVESAAAMLLTAPFMGGGTTRNDNQSIIAARWNIANNPELYKSVTASQLKAGEITQEEAVQKIAKIDQYSKALETLPIKNKSSIRDMKTLLENKDAQYDFFSKHLEREALLEYVPTDEELPEYTKQLETLDADLYKTQQLADKYDALSIEDKKKIIYDNFKSKLNNLITSDDVSPAAVSAALAQAGTDYKKNKNRLFSTELEGHINDLEAAMDGVKGKFISFIANNNEGLTSEQRNYKVQLLALNKKFFETEEVDKMLDVLIKAEDSAYAPLFEIQDENDFIEALARNYVTAKTNERPLTSDGKLLYNQIEDEYVNDGLFQRFVDKLPEEEAAAKKDELKNRFWARQLELKQNQQPGQVFPEVGTAPITKDEKFDAAAAETTSKYKNLIANYRVAVERDLTEDQQVIREETIDGLVAEESVEDLVKGLASVQSIFIGDNLKKIAQEVQEGKTDKLVEFLEENGATKKQIEKLLNKIGKPAETKAEDKKSDVGRNEKLKNSIVNKLKAFLSSSFKFVDTASELQNTLASIKQNLPNIISNQKEVIKLLNELNTILNNQFKDSNFLSKQEQNLLKSILTNLDANGYEIVEMLDKEYKEGMQVTATFVPSKNENSNTGKTVITKVVTPQINYNGTSIQTAQIEATQNYDAKYDAELLALKEAKPKVQIEADLKAKKEEIEKKRQEELKEEERRTAVSIYEVEFEDNSGDIRKSQVIFFKDGSGKIIQFDIDGKRLPGETKINKELREITKNNPEEIVNRALGENAKTISSQTENIDNAIVNKINAKYDVELAKVLQQEVEQLGSMMFDFTPEEQRILREYASEAIPTVETISPESLTEPVTEPPNETKEDEVYETQQKLNQEAEATQAIEDVRENYVYLGIHDTQWTVEDANKTRLADENVEFVFGFIDRIEESINSADMRSLGYNLLMHSSREVLNRVGLDIQPKSTLEEFSEQFRVNGIPVLPQEQIEALFKNPNALDTTKLGIVTNEKGEPLFFDKFGQKVTTGTPIMVRIGQVYEQETNGGKTLDKQFKKAIPAEGQIAPLSKFINGKTIVRKPISVKESNSLIMHVGKPEQVPAGKGFFTLYPGVIYLPTGNSNFPYRSTFSAYNTKESADKVVTLIEAYNNAKLNPEESTLSEYFTSMTPVEFIKYLHNYAFIPKNSLKSPWGIVPVALKGEKQASLVRIYNNSNKNEDIPREEAVNLISSVAASPSREFFEGDIEFRPFTVQGGKVKTGKAISFKTWYGNFRNSGARIDGVANRNIAFAKQDVKPLTQPLALPLVEAKTPTEVVIESVLPEVVVTQVSDKKADIENNDFVVKIKKIGQSYAGGKQFVNTKQTGKEFLEQLNYEMYGEKVQPEHLLYFKDTFGGQLYDLINRGYKELTGKTFEEYDAELAVLEQPTTTTEDIEARKANIERRRQEYLKIAKRNFEFLNKDYISKLEENTNALKEQYNFQKSELLKNTNDLEFVESKYGKTFEDWIPLQIKWLKENKASLLVDSRNSESRDYKILSLLQEKNEAVNKINAKYDAELAALETTPTAPVISEEGKLPNDIKEEFKGKFIYATPGAGKTTLAQGMQGVVDTDVLMIEEMKKRHPEFFAEAGESIQNFIFRYVKTHDHKEEINKIVLSQAKKLASEGNTVLTGTVAFIKDADIVITAPVTLERVAQRFKNAQAAETFANKEAEEIRKAGKISEPITNFLEFYLTNKGFTDPTTPPSNLPTRRGKRGDISSVILERSKLYTRQVTEAQEKAAERWVNTIGKKAFGDNRYLIEQLLTNPEAWAIWSEAAGMVLFADASFADLYHESWHEFSQLYFTPKQSETLYKLAAKIYGKLPTEELEERLAEDFRQFMLTGVMPESIQKYKDARTTFQKIADFLRNLFSNKKTVDRYFKNLAKGKVGNRVGKPGFKTLKSAKALSLYDENDKLVTLSFEESKRYLDMIDEAFVMMGDYLAVQSKEAEIAQDPEAERGVSFANLMYSPANIEAVYDRIFDYFAELEDQAAEVGDLTAQQQFVKIFGIENKNIEELFRYHKRNSSLFTPEMITEMEEAEQEDLVDTNLIKDELGSKSQLELAPAVVVNLIRSIPMVDSKGFIISNSLTDAPMFGDFTENWNILKNSLSGATSYEEILERIENLIPEYPQFQYLLDRLPVKITLDSAQQLRNSFFNIMSLEKVEGIQGVFNNEGKFNVNNTGTLDTKRVRDLWSLQFATEKKGNFKTVSAVTGNYVVSPELFNEYPEAPKSPEDILNFLKEIGFNYSSRAQQAFLKDFNRLRPKFEYVYDKLRDVVLNSGTEVSDPFLAIRQAHVNANTNQSIKGKSYDLDRLVELESLYNLAFANDMVQVADGTSKFITTSPTYQTKVVAALNDPKYTYFEDLFTEFPELDPSKNWGLANSAYLAYLFDFTTDTMVDGQVKHKRNMREGKPVSLAIVSMDGITAEEDYGFNQKTIDLEDPEKHLADIKTLLAPYGRVEENNRIGEKSTTRGLMLSADNYFLYNKDFYYDNNQFALKPQIANIIYKYLEAESKITDRTSVSENFNRNKLFEGTPQLAYFSEMLDPALRSQVYEFFKTKTVEDFEESALKGLVKTAITSWIANQALTSQRLLSKFEGYKVKGKNNDFQVSLNELKRYHTLSMIHRIEQYKLFNYHPYYYKNAKEVEKRIPAFNADGLFPVIDQENLQYTQASLTMQKAFEKYANEMGMEVLPRKGSLSDITYLVGKDEALDSQTARENKEDYGIHYNSYAETKKPVEVQDAASVILLDFFRKFYALSKGLTKPMKDELDRQSTIWTNLLALKTNSANAEARENLNKALNTPPHFIFSVKKFQYAGPGLTESESEAVPVFHKYSNKILLPSEMVDNEEMFNIAVKLHASNADYLVFKTGTKIAETVQPVPLFDKGKVDTTPKETGLISLRYLKEQQEIEHKTDDLIIFATQFRKLLFKDVTTQEEKDLLEDYKIAIKELTGYDVDNFLSKIKDKKAAVEFLIKELDKKNVSAITKDLIRFNEETQELEYAVDSVIERTLAENAITSAIKKSIIRQKFNGTQFVQFPVSLVRPNRKLKFYRIKDGKIASAEAMIAFSKKYYSLLDLPFDQKSTIGKRDKNGKPINPYDALKRLNQKLADDAFRETYKDSLTLAGVRIPVQGYNSMEKMEIVEFLPEESGNIILVADELVVKSGGDFDIDKLFMYEPILRNGVMLTYENSDAKKLEDLAKAPEGRTREEIEKGAALTKLTIEEYMAKTGFTIMESEDLRSATKPKHLLEAAAEREQRGLLQNNLLNVIKERLSQKEIFQDLIEPNNVKELDEYAKSAPEYLSGDTNKIIKDSSGRDMWTNLVNPHYQLYVYQLAHAMEMVGVSAKANTFQSAVQDAKLEIIDQDAIDLIYFDTNKNSEGNIKLWEIYDVDKINKISQIISQFISGSVDVVKNDNILKNNINPNTVSVALYLNMMGVRYKDINTFLKDEAIYRYSKGETLQEILRDSFREYYDEFGEFTKSGNFSNYGTAVNILNSTNKEKLLTDKSEFGSLARLAQFVVLKTQQANYITPLIIGTDYDTQSVRNFESVTRKEQDITEVYKSNFFNKEGLNKIVYESTVSPFRVGSSFIQNFESMFPISANKGLIDFISSKYKDLKKTWIDYDNFSRRLKNALLTSILETNMDEFQEFAQYLKVDPSVKNLGDILTEIKTEAAQNGAYIPLLDSIYFVGNINSDYIAPAVFRNDNNLDIDVKKEQFKNNLNWDSAKEQEVSEEFRNKVRNFFRIFAYTGIISTQLNKTHGSFLEIIPEEIYTPIIDRFVKETSTDIAKGKDSEFLTKFYNRFNYNNPDIFRSPSNVTIPNPSLKFYRNYNLNITEEEVENEYSRMVDKVKPSPAPVPMAEAIFTPDLEESRKEPLPEVKADTVAEVDELTKQNAISVFDFLSDDKSVDQDIIDRANEMPDDESTCGPPA